MPIQIDRVDERYRARVSPPHGRGRRWETRRPLELEDLIAKLQELGCPQADIGDALHEADPEWEFRLKPD